MHVSMPMTIAIAQVFRMPDEHNFIIFMTSAVKQMPYGSIARFWEATHIKIDLYIYVSNKLCNFIDLLVIVECC